MLLERLPSLLERRATSNERNAHQRRSNRSPEDRPRMALSRHRPSGGAGQLAEITQPHRGYQPLQVRRSREGGSMSIWLLILIIVVVVLLLGGFGYSRRA